LEHVFQCESGNADAVFKHIDVAILVKLKHLVDGFQHGFDVFVVVYSIGGQSQDQVYRETEQQFHVYQDREAEVCRHQQLSCARL
jgi:hypothetical protein